MSLTTESIEYTKSTPIAKRKALGQYMTPGVIGDALLENLVIPDGVKVLDPAVGTGELLLATLRKAAIPETIELHGWDVDPEILKIAPAVVPSVKLRQQSVFDTIDKKWEGYFDFIIGNPPYFELKKNDYDSTKYEVASGRTNIYSIFFEAYLPLLKEGGYLAYIIPPSMNAGAYFSKLREFILKNSEIISLKIVRENQHFTDALTSVQLLVLQKKVKAKASTNNKHVADFSKLSGNMTAPTVFTDDRKAIEDAWDGKTSLYDLGYEAVTGTVPWNQHKTQLSSQQTEKATILYYAKDISSSNAVKLSPLVSERRWLTSGKPPFFGTHIIVNRIVGSLDNPRLKVALVDEKNGFYGENHLNVIRVRPNVEPKVTFEELFEKLTNYPGLSKYLQAFTGNTQLSAKELTHLLPL